MVQEKKGDSQPQPHQAKQDVGKMFQRFLSDVATAGQAVLKEAKAMQTPENPKKPLRREELVSAGDKATASFKAAITSVSKSKAQPVVPPLLTKKSYPQNEITKLCPSNPSPVTPTAVVEIPKEVINQPFPLPVVADNDWELLSVEERASKTSNGSFVACPRAGSVRSITSVDHETSSHTTLSVPFKIQRTSSSSTLDSQDNVIGPSGKGVLGVDYIEHVVLPTDTLQGICIAYKVSATHLRRANHFTGTLHSAPKKLVIPMSKQALRTGFIRVQDTDTKEYKLHFFEAEFPDINTAEAKAYLELADWDLKDAMQSVKEDREWMNDDEGDDNRSNPTEKNLKSGQIGIKVDFRSGIPIFNLRGTGFPSFSSKKSKKPDSSSNSNGETSDKVTGKDEKEKVIIYKRPPAIATKSVFAQDLYNAAPQHESYGFELQPITKS
ncbi:MAG: hypothetical protein SGILL_000468 [Bacillariaceae sp.]